MTSVSATVSPSRRSFRRSTPWVAGCWGPMLMSSISVRNISVLSPELDVVPVEPPDRVFLAQGVPLPLVGQENPPQVRMPLEGDSQQVEGLPLVPVGGAPDAGHAGDLLALGRP